jgi:predicted nucleic acid-binding protein
MKMQVVIDTGPLVASLHRDDQYHDWARQQAASLPRPFLTCEAVLTEAYFLLRTLPVAQQGLSGLLRDGLVQVPFHLAEEIDAVTDLMERYANVPMSFADACLVQMSELYSELILNDVQSN